MERYWKDLKKICEIFYQRSNDPFSTRGGPFFGVRVNRRPLRLVAINTNSKSLVVLSLTIINLYTLSLTCSYSVYNSFLFVLMKFLNSNQHHHSRLTSFNELFQIFICTLYYIRIKL